MSVDENIYLEGISEAKDGGRLVIITVNNFLQDQHGHRQRFLPEVLSHTLQVIAERRRCFSARGPALPRLISAPHQSTPPSHFTGVLEVLKVLRAPNIGDRKLFCRKTTLPFGEF